ncbi:response regulator [Ancylobacter sp. 6x-1]|uniref:Response regulator n=1 Tax=Ancylobacter crimeensis TaxID=2579147 RepID=A0ABT0DFJ9_9HYPH|nr:response regulator [Ancylobacter crimeensis]MCK0198730.1 response regulator [Ancylobacter crimeensis]
MTRRVHIIDDEETFRVAIGRLLRAHGYDTAEYPSAERFLEQVSGRTNGCILLDVAMPGLSGPELQARLSAASIHLPIVFLTGHGDVPTSVRAIKAGAEDFLVKPIAGTELIEIIEKALARHDKQHAHLEWIDDARAMLATLTPREREVFDQVVRGKLNKQTAHLLGITERTIKAHRQRIFDKLKAHTVAELVSLAERLGILGTEGAER